MTDLQHKARQSKAGARKRRRRVAARARKRALPYQLVSRPETRRVRENRKAERFDVPDRRGWLIVRAVAGRFRHCADSLRSAGCRVFEARQEVRTSNDGRHRVSHPPMLRRLMFASVEAPEYACLLASLEHVEAVLCRGEGVWIWADEVGVQGARPAVVPPEMMQAFADHVTGHKRGDREVHDFVESLFAVGDSVLITKTAFASYSGVVQEVEEKSGRYGVDVSIFGRAKRVWLEDGQMEAA